MTFQHTPIPQLPPLKRRTVAGRRHYQTPEGALYPSVTTVTGILAESAIAEWRARIGEEQANKISREACRRGSAVHALAERYLGNVGDYQDGYRRNDIALFRTIRPILDRSIDNICALEVSLYSDQLRVAGQVDCVAEFDGTLSVIDFKTSGKPKKREWIGNYFQQEAAYASMFEERTNLWPITQLVTIVAVDKHDPQVFVEKTAGHLVAFHETRELYRREYEQRKAA